MKAVNLLPNDQRGAAKVVAAATPAKKAPAGDSFGAYVILGALALAVVAVAAMVLTKNTIADRTAELARVDQQVQAVAREAAALKPYADFKQLAEARVQTVQSLATSRFDWERTLRDLSRALPSDTRLSSFSGKVAGGDGAAATGGTASPSIDLAGCTGSQTSTAKLMARLRSVRGVTRVSLKSSAKSGGGGTATSAGTGTLCKKGTAPTFAMTIYFDRFNVPAVSAPAGAGAGGATGPTGPTGGIAPAPGTTTTAPATSATQGVSTP